MCGCSGGMHGCSGGVCVVALGGCMVALGGVRGCWGGVHGIRRDTEIRSMSGRYASYWNAFLYVNISMITDLISSLIFFFPVALNVK